MGRPARQPRRNSNRNNYRSKFERSFAGNLTKRGIKFEYEPYKLIYYRKKCGKCLNCGSKDIADKHSYTPDFKIGNTLIETKGRLTSTDRTKMKAVKESNPDLDIRFIFMYDNWLTKSKKTRYSDWCKRNGFKFEFMKLPKEWAKDILGVNK